MGGAGATALPALVVAPFALDFPFEVGPKSDGEAGDSGEGLREESAE